jgi:hypothetical protein
VIAVEERRCIHVPANLFELASIGDPFPQDLARWRRRLVTLWLVAGGQALSVPDLAGGLVRAVWRDHERALQRAGRVTVVTALVQLQSLGFVESFEQVEGGFAVELVKEAA